MRLPLLLQVYRSLRRGWKQMSHEAQMSLRAYVLSQKRGEGYLNRGGKVDAYYTQFGDVLEAVFSPLHLIRFKWGLTVSESLHRDDIYGQFFRFIKRELNGWQMLKSLWAKPLADVPLYSGDSTNALCCMLCMQHQCGTGVSQEKLDTLIQSQDQTGGFKANALAPVPDILSTAVALFTLRLLGRKALDASDFIDAHWLADGSFAPTLLDEQSDVEYIFYGLLALGSNA